MLRRYRDRRGERDSLAVGCGWVFSNSVAIKFCNLRVGSKVHPCTVEPEMRIHAHFTLVRAPHYKKTHQPPPKSAKLSRSPFADTVLPAVTRFKAELLQMIVLR